MAEQTSTPTTDQYQQRCVCFMDILGFAGLVERAHTDEDLRRDLAGKLKIIKPKSPFFGDLCDFRIQHFSDSVVFSTECTIDGMLHLINMVRTFQLSMVSIDVLMRGAVTVGGLFVDDDIIFGTALNEAYLAETKLAKYPRVILSPAAIAYIEAKGPHLLSEFNALTMRDDDGVFFVHYLARLSRMEESIAPTAEDKVLGLGILALIRNRLASVFDNPGVYQKVEWLAGYWNRAMEVQEPFPRRFPSIQSGKHRPLLDPLRFQQNPFSHAGSEEK